MHNTLFNPTFFQVLGNSIDQSYPTDSSSQGLWVISTQTQDLRDDTEKDGKPMKEEAEKHKSASDILAQIYLWVNIYRTAV